MKKHINLLYGKNKYAVVERGFYYFKMATFFLGIVVIILISAILFIKYQTSNDYEVLLSKKEALIKDSLQRSDVETKAVFVNDKSAAVKGFINEDVNFLPYYRVLKEYLPVSSDSASIKLISFDNQKNANFQVEFRDYESYLNFISSIESDRFLSIFDVLILESFTASEKVGSVYRLNFQGKFKPVNENQN